MTISTCPMTSAQQIGRASQQTTMRTRRLRPARQIVSASDPATTTCQMAAAAGNGNRASGRKRIASSGGLRYVAVVSSDTRP